MTTTERLAELMPCRGSYFKGKKCAEPWNWQSCDNCIMRPAVIALIKHECERVRQKVIEERDSRATELEVAFGAEYDALAATCTKGKT